MSTIKTNENEIDTALIKPQKRYYEAEIYQMRVNKSQGIGCQMCDYGTSNIYCRCCADYYSDWDVWK